MNNFVNFNQLSEERYQSLETKNSGTFYLTEENLYLGEILLSSHIATTEKVGIVKPDNNALSVDENGCLHVIWGDIPEPQIKAIENLNIDLAEFNDTGTSTMNLNFLNTEDLTVGNKTVASYKSTSLVQNKINMPVDVDDGITVKTFEKEDAGKECNYTVPIKPENYGETQFYKTFSTSDGTNSTVIEGAGNKINIPIPETIPTITVKQPITYNGKEQYPFSNYSTNQLDVSGSICETNAGDYSCTFTPKPGYRWQEDNSTSAKQYNWNIQKINVNVNSWDFPEFNPDVSNWTLSDNTGQFTVPANTKIQMKLNYNGDGKLVVTSSNTNILKVTTSGKIAEFTASGSGAVLSYYIEDSTNYTYTLNQSHKINYTVYVS